MAIRNQYTAVGGGECQTLVGIGWILSNEIWATEINSMQLLKTAYPLDLIHDFNSFVNENVVQDSMMQISGKVHILLFGRMVT